MRLRRIFIASFFLMALKIVGPQGHCLDIQQYEVDRFLSIKDAKTFYEVFDAKKYCWTSSYVKDDDNYEITFHSNEKIRYTVRFSYDIVQSVECSYKDIKIDCDNIQRDLDRAKLLQAIHERTR